MNNIFQLKRILNYNGTYDNAINCIKTRLDPKLKEGEPIICSYKNEKLELNYFLAICTNESTNDVVTFPSFTDLNEFIKFIDSIISASAVNENNVDEKSDVTVTKDENGLFVLKIKNGGSTISADNVNYTYINNGEPVTITQSKFNETIVNDVSTLKDIVKWKKLLNN